MLINKSLLYNSCFLKEMIFMWTYNYTDELYHYGVKGMKWGVRRYRNYDGSYTRAGVKRFDDSLAKYEKADKRYKEAKRSGSKTELTNSKLARKQAKQKLVKDYKHLKQDKLGDQGKMLYASGKTITGNDAVTSMLTQVGSLSLSVAGFNAKTGAVTQAARQVIGNVGHTQLNQILIGVGGASLAVAGAKRVVDERQNKRLRAYYGHTSNY